MKISKIETMWDISCSAQKKLKALTLTEGGEESYPAVHPFLSEQQFFDCCFVVGDNPPVSIQANRAVLGSMNAALYKMLYGTG
jgi:hypothetical protein